MMAKIYYIEIDSGIPWFKRGKEKHLFVTSSFVDDYNAAYMSFMIEASKHGIKYAEPADESRYNPHSKLKPLLYARNSRIPIVCGTIITLYELEVGV